jgi:hypothetical protein
MTSGQQRSKRSALSDKGGHVYSVADCKNYAEILGDIPAFSSCAEEVLEEFVTYGVQKAHHLAGETLSSQMHRDPNCYVVVSGTATLDAGDDVRVTLIPGDYFGHTPGHIHPLVGSVTADVDVDVLVIRPQEALQLERASSKHHHPSQIEWRSEFAEATPRPTHRRLRALVTS